MQKQNIIKKILASLGFSKAVRDVVRTKEKVLRSEDITKAPFHKFDYITKHYMNWVYGNQHFDTTQQRIEEYWRLVHADEVNNAITEIVDEMVNEEEEVLVQFSPPKFSSLNEETKAIINERFKNLMSRLGLFDYGLTWDLIYKWIVQGVLKFVVHYEEEVIDEERGFKTTRIESIEEVNPWDLVKVVDGDDEIYVWKKVKKDEQGHEMVVTEKLLPEQVIEVTSGYVLDGKTASILEFMKPNYRRLMLMEDSAVIYRLLRSPLRRVFYVYVGEMSPQQAEIYLQEFKLAIKEEVDMSKAKDDITAVINPVSLLDDFYFPEYSDGVKGATVETLDERGNANWNIMEEVLYFLRKLYRSVKIPTSRIGIGMEGENPAIVVGSRLGEITRDEVRFSRFIRRLQIRFAQQFYEKLLILELLVSGLLKELNVIRSDIRVVFNKPNHFEELKMADLWDTRINNYNQLAGQEFLSIRFLQKKFLHLTEEELEENIKLLKEEQKLRKEIEMAGEEGFGGGFAGGFGGGGGGTLPPPGGELAGGFGGEEMTPPPEAGGGEEIGGGTEETAPPPEAGGEEAGAE